jgi:DNA-binding PadR family transcriptional regulator
MESNDLGRFSDPGLLILASLAGGAKHGYAIMEDIEATSGVHLGPGTLYGAISRLEGGGLIEALPVDERRRPYRLTQQGVSFLRQYLDSMQKFISIGFERLEA